MIRGTINVPGGGVYANIEDFKYLMGGPLFIIGWVIVKHEFTKED